MDGTVGRIETLVLAGGAAVLGLALVAGGYRLMRDGTRIVSALLFTALGVLIGASAKSVLLGIIATAALGGLGYLLGDAIYFATMALNGAAAGGTAALAACAASGSQELGLPIWIGITAGGVLGVIFEHPIGILGTSLVGAAAFSLGLWFAAPALQEAGWIHALLFVGMTIVGCALQSHRPGEPRSEEARKA